MKNIAILLLILFAKSEPMKSRELDSIHNIEERYPEYFGTRAEGIDPDAVPLFSPMSWLEGRL